MDNKKIKFFIKKSPSCFKTNIYILKQMRGGFYIDSFEQLVK
ncbi:hypothetical protein CHCC20348_4446 [Bacillus paralicheniformis]|nr:hypothetical protein CHCC20348_4446 [Bacillus paralicheniformis]